MFFYSSNNKVLPEELYSSWPLVDVDDCYKMHCGTAKKTTGTVLKTLDKVNADYIKNLIPAVCFLNVLLQPQ